MADYIELTDATFKTEVEEYQGVVLVDFWAPWCGPCQIMGPVIEEIAAETKANKTAKVAKIVVDDNPQTAEKYQVSSIPTLIAFKDGKVVDQRLGAVPKSEVTALLEKAKAA